MTGALQSIRPVGLARGTTAFLAAWVVAVAIARLTGAAAVLLLLAAGVVAFAGTVISAVLAVRRVRIATIDVSPITTAGSDTALSISVTADGRIPVGSICVFDGSHRLAVLDLASFDAAGAMTTTVVFEHPGVRDHLTLDVVSAGVPGLFWMRRRAVHPLPDIHIAPPATGPCLRVEHRSTANDGMSTSRTGLRHGEIDGVRPWRDGDSDGAVHWPSSIRAGAMIVHDRQASHDRSWVVDVPATAIDASFAGRVHFTVLQGIHDGHEVSIRRPESPDGPGALRTVHSTSDAHRLAAELIDAATVTDTPMVPWYRQPLRLTTRLDTAIEVGAATRWLSAVATTVALWMLLGALESGPVSRVLSLVGIAAGAAVSQWCSKRFDPTLHSARALRPVWLQGGIAAATFGSLAYVATSVGGVTGLLSALRGPMPDLLMLLAVIHGFDVVDRRTLRVHQAIGAVMVAYATGLRIDDGVGWWMAAWAVVVVAAVRTSILQPATVIPARNRTATPRRARTARGLASVVAGGAAVLGILSVVPVPDGPAQLGLPADSNDAPEVPIPGALAGPGGGAVGSGDGTRGSLGQAGGYPGFSESLDTSVRGDLGDEVVMRVRAPEPAFWRGQTFTEFDGRTWHVSPERGRPQRSGRSQIEPTLGDGPRPGSGLQTEEFLQTYYVETDLPNVVFAASRPDIVTFDGSIWARPDGSLRSDVTLTPGSVYTVASERVQVTPALLRAQGDISEYFAAFTNPATRTAFEPLLSVPESTTRRTIDLATSLRLPGASTYDTILAYQRWLAENTEYDLDAPVPGRGADAVDDFLFESTRGFCEQIASSLAIMLRTQGVPARIATGYIPGTRDRVSGVFEVRASDAHAWVEVWFPETGWEAFDPTAEVPLAGEAEETSVGGDLVDAATATITAHPVKIGLVLALLIVLAAVARLTATAVARRRRGRWGVLQDRFAELSTATAQTNPARAGAFNGSDTARELAVMLDRAVCDPAWTDSDAGYQAARATLRQLESTSR